MKNLIAVAVCAAGLAGYAADDHLVDVGSSETLAANTEYGRLVVNGDLTVGADVELKVASLCVATNIAGTANLVLEAGAKLTVTGEGSSDCVIGIDGGRANVSLASGAYFTATKIKLGLGYAADRTVAAGAQATFASVVVNDAVFEATAGEDGLCLQNSNYNVWPKNTAATTPASEIVLNQGGELRVKQITHYPARLADIIFNGGKLKTNGCPWKKGLVSVTWMNGSKRLRFISQNANPIDIYLWDNHSTILSGGSAGSTLEFSGDGDVIIDGKNLAGQSPNLSTRSLVSNGVIYWLNAGKIIIRDGIVQLNGMEKFGDATYCPPHDFEVSGGGKVDLNGQSFTVKTLSTGGQSSLANSGADCTLTMDNGAEDWSLVRKLSVPSNVRLVKRGSGTLSMPEGYAPNLTVEEGGVCLTGRAITGYPFYKFNVYATGDTGLKDARVRIAELVYLNGEEDVTQGWQALYYTCSGTSYYNSPTNALDGDKATFFYDQRAQSYSAVSNIHFELEYPLPRKVTGYKWTYHTGIDSYNSNPTSWEVFGSDDNVNWVSLDYVEYQKAGWTGWTTRTCTIPPADDYAMSLAAGTALKVVGADVSGKVTAASDTLALEKGAKVELTAGTKVAELTIDADDATDSTVVNFDFAETGVLNVIGSARRLPAALPLALPDAADAVLSGWTVTYNGEPAHYLPVVKNGRLTRQSTQGLLILVR